MKKQLPAILAGIGVLGLVLTLLLPSLGVNLFGPPAQAKPPAAQAAQCETSDATYYAAKAPRGSNNFGPTQHATDADAAYQRLLAKMAPCSGDPLFTATTTAFQADGLNLSASKVEARAANLVGDRNAWSQQTDAFKSSVVSYTVKNDPRSYHTLGMVAHGSDMPSLIAADENVKIGWALVVKFDDGTTREFRISCDMQPVGPKFPNVPAKPTTPGKSSGCVPSSGNHNCSSPGCTSNCSHGGGCTHNCKTTKHYCPGTHNPVPPNGLCPKHPSQDPQSQRNVPKQATKNHPDRDNGDEISRGPVKPRDSGNGIGTDGPRSTPAPAPTHKGGGPSLPKPTQSAAPPSNSATAGGPLSEPSGTD